MARPAPDPDLVMRAYELTHVSRMTRRQVADQLGISTGTVQAWLQEASRWLAELEAQAARVEREGQDQFTNYLLREGLAEYQAGRIEWAEFARASTAILKRRADLLGADLGKGGAGEPATPLEPAQAEAVRRMLARNTERRQTIVEGRIL